MPPSTRSLLGPRPPTRSPRSCPDFAKGYEIPGLAEFTKQFPTAAEVIDSYFDFAQQILTSQREFAHRIVAATKRAAK